MGRNLKFGRMKWRSEAKWLLCSFSEEQTGYVGRVVIDGICKNVAVNRKHLKSFSVAN